MNPKKSSPAGWAAMLGVGVLATVILAVNMNNGNLPVPNPTPPKPDPTYSHLAFITDNANRTQDQAAIYISDELIAYLAKQKVSWRQVDKDAEVYAKLGYDKLLAADNLKPPALVLVSPDESTHKSVAMPATVADIEAWIGGIQDGECPSIEFDGHKRYLTCLPPSASKFMAPRGGPFSAVAANIPRALWKEINNRAKFPADQWIYDQNGYGACVGNGSTDAFRKIRVMAGMADVRLAPGCTYAGVNGGVDRGASISDSLTFLQQTGTISAKTLGSDQSPHFLKQLPKGWQEEAKRFRIEEAYKCENYDEMGTALQLGYTVVYGMQVGQSFMKFDANGVAGHASGPGNHCMHADGMHKLPGGEWVLDNVNSWGVKFGPWGNGRCYLDEQHFLHGDQTDFYAIKTSIEDPLEPNKPPVPKKATLGCGCGPDCKCGECDCLKAGKCSPGCTCCPAKPSTPPEGIKKKVSYEWRTVEGDQNQQALYGDGEQIGNWNFDRNAFYAVDVKTGSWNKADCPVKAPARPKQAPMPQLQLSPWGGLQSQGYYCPPGRS